MCCNYNFYDDSRNYGSISCSSTPSGASIYINDNSTGLKTSAYISGLRPGKYWIKYIYPEYRSDSSVANVQAQKTVSFSSNLIDTSRFVDFTRETGEYYHECVLCDKNGRIITGTAYGGLFIYSEGKFKNYNTGNSSIPSNMVTFLFQDSDENIWVATSLGVVKISAAGIWEIFKTSNSVLPVNLVQSICEDGGKNIWMATKSGLVKYYNGNWEVFTVANSSLQSNYCTSLCSTNDNSLWIGYYKTGVSKYQNGVWTHFPITSFGLSNDYSYWRVFCDNGSNVFSICSSGVYSYSSGSWSKTTKYTGLCSFFDSENTLWISTSYGYVILKKDGTQESFYFYNDSYLKDVIIRGITQDKNKNIWFATYDKGLVKYKYYK